jgi:hypothetical protein
MTAEEMHFNIIYKDILTNSLFTDRQMYIIYESLVKRKTVGGISRGAYYRQLKQCRHKIVGILYSILLLQSIGAIDHQSLSILQSLSESFSVMSKEGQSDVTSTKQMENVIFILKNTLNKMCNE